MRKCYYCFGDFDDEFDMCPHCGEIYDPEPELPIHLYPGTVLENKGKRYIIGKFIDAGGFGIIYRAWEEDLARVVAVKEFYMGRLVKRVPGETEVIINKRAKAEFGYRKQRFLSEAQSMAKFGDHPSIPNVYDFFEANGTAYFAMELLDGVDLNEYMKNNDCRKDMDFVLTVANEVGHALKSIHEKGIYHCDVAPDNIKILSGGSNRIKLFDFGAAKLADATDDFVDIVMKPGYSPVELYYSTMPVGPWTDVYSLGATLYHLLTGVKPDESTNRKITDLVEPPHELDKSIPEQVSNAIMKALAIDRHLRFRNVDEFLACLNGKKKTVSLKEEKRKRKTRRSLQIIAATLAVTAVGLAGFGIFTKERNEHILKPADISVWYSVEEGSSEDDAMNAVKEDFEETFEGVNVELRGIPAQDYAEELENAAKAGQLPDLFESTGIPDELLKNAHPLDKVIDSQQFADCLFLDSYNSYYDTALRVPLAIEVPMAFVITNGVECIDYDKEYFTALSDFSYEGITADERYLELCSQNFGEQSNTGHLGFFDNTENTTALLLSSSMAVNEVRETLTNYEKAYVHYDSDRIYCRFTYEWSVGNGSEEQKAAAQKLLSWMLGNVYQNTLMITRCSDGQIPVNKSCFESKITADTLAPIGETYKKFVFERGE